MGVYGFQRKTLAIAVAGVLLGVRFAVAPKAQAAGFINDFMLTGNIFYWQSELDRKDFNPVSSDDRKYTTNLSHFTTNLNLDFFLPYV